MKKGTAAAWSAARARWPRLARLLEAGERDEGARGEAEGGDDRVGVDEREEQVPAQEVRPPVGLRVPGEDEGEVGEEERPGDERHREGGSAEAGGERAQGEDEGEGPERHVEAGERVPGVGPGPAQGGGADEVRAEVVAEGEAGDARDLRRVADHELAREAHVEGGVERHERVEEEVAGGVEAVPAVLGEREQGHEGEAEREERLGARGSRRGARGRGAGGGSPRGGPGQGEEPRPVGGEAQPVSAGTPGSSERDDEGRVERGPGEPLQGEAREEDREPTKSEPGGKPEG